MLWIRMGRGSMQGGRQGGTSRTRRTYAHKVKDGGARGGAVGPRVQVTGPSCVYVYRVCMCAQGLGCVCTMQVG